MPALSKSVVGGVMSVISFMSFLLLLASAPLRAAEPFISEFMPDNARVLADEDGQFPDWIEIQNPNATPFDLAGYFLTDNPAQLNKWAFPSVTLPPNGFLVVFASGKNRTSDTNRLHTNFQLDAGGGFLALVKPNGATIASAFTNYPSVKEDVSFGIAQQQLATSLVANSAPQILVPTNAAELPANWNQLAYAPGSNWTNGIAPPAVGYDTNTAVGNPVNVASSGTAAQSTINGSFTPNLAINNNFGDFTHTLGTDTLPFWQLTLTNRMAIFSVLLYNRTSCCQSRLRDITFEILSTNETGLVTNYTSPLLNPENAGFSYPGGPANLSNNLVALTGGPVFGQIIRVRRAADLDLSGSGGQGNADEAAVLSLGEVVVNATTSAGLRAFVRTDLESLMLGKASSAFVRMPFVSTNTPETLSLRARYDDGFIAYLNGTEIARRNAPVTPAWDSTATADRNFASATTQETIDVSLGIPLLVTGANVLAVHVMNFSAANSDLLFESELIGSRLQTTPDVFLVDATPGTLNTTDFYYDEVRDTHFSVDRGFFEAPFSLSITSGTPDALIYVSFNGDEPGPGKGFLYTNAFTITNTSVVRVRAFKTGWKPTDVDTHTYLFLGDVIYQAANWEQTRIPPTNFPASWGANAVDYGMDPQVVTNYTLAQWKEALTQIPTMSIVTEMKNLFDPTTGIYANASGHGEEWERPMSLELLDPTNAVPGRFQENGGLRIRGGFSRNPQFFKHSFRVFFNRGYGAGSLDYPLFGDEGAQTFDKFDLRTSQNYSWPRNESPTFDTMVREVFARKTLGDMGQPYRRSRYYHLYINGQYWGLYETDERPSAYYGEVYFGGSKTNYDVVKCGNRSVTPNFMTEATDGNFVAWSNLWQMCQAMRTNASTSNYFRPLGCNPDGTRNPNMEVLIDVDNLIDYMMGIFFTGDGDATLSAFLSNNQANNWFGMRDRTNPNVGFRFFNSDCEHTLGSPSSQNDRTGPFGGSNEGIFMWSNPQWMHEELMRNAEYRVRFADHVQKHFFNGGALTLEACTNRFIAKANQITKAIRAYSARWGDAIRTTQPYGESDWTNAIAFCLNWLVPRGNIVLAQLRADQLFPTNSAPNFSQNGGAVPGGYALTLTQTNGSGVIYFTLDGTDPRAVGGGVSASAQAYSGSLIINSPTTVRARVLVNGVWSALMEATFFPPQDLSKLLVTEIMYHPPALGLTDGDEFEFLELKNAGTNALNLNGLRFTGITFTFTNGTTLAPGGFFVLARNAAQFTARYPGVSVNGVYTGGLNNGGETITLLHPLGTEVLSVSYGDLTPWPVTPDGFGFSLVPVNPNANPDLDNAANWRASSFAGGSPGADDPAQTIPRVLISEVLTHSETGVDFIELYNPARTNVVNIGGWFLTDDPAVPMKYRIPDGQTIAPGTVVVFDELDFNPTPGTNNSFSLNGRGDDVYLFSGDVSTNLTGYDHGFSFGAAADGDTFGLYVISTGEEQFPAQIEATPGALNRGPRIGPVVITEIMYNPPFPLPEFIELKNISSNAVTLFDPTVPTNTWRLNGIDFTFPTNVTLPPLGFALITATNIIEFTSRYSTPAGAQIFGPYSGNLQDSGERLELQRPDVPETNGTFAYITVDEVRYNDKAPWSPAADGSGPSLQKRIATLYGNEPLYWSAAAPTPGADFIGGSLPVITTQPLSETAIAGSNVTFTVAVSGSAPFSYAWRFNGDNIPGATNASLVLPAIQPSHAGAYSVFVFNSAGSTLSSNATLIVLLPVAFTLHPTNQNVLPGTNVTLTANAVGNGTLRYQWRFEGTPIPNATNAAYSFTGANLSSHHGNFSVEVRDDISVAVSSNAFIFVLVRPAFVLQPTAITIAQGGTAIFTCLATGAPPIYYRWIRNGVGVQTSTVPVLVLTNVQIGSPNPVPIRCAATNMASGVGGVNSLTINMLVQADADGDGAGDPWETQYGFSTNNVADGALDFDGDGMSNRDEFRAGTNPTNVLSVLKLALTAPGASVLEFVAQSNLSYSVQFRTNLSSAFWTSVTNVAGLTNTVRTIQVTAPNPAPDPERYYRVATPAAP